MKELSLNILDVAMNSVAAGATLVQILIDESQTGKMILRIVDNGCGMDEETLHHVTDPFYTTRKTRKVGLGLPFLRMTAEQTGGTFSVSSTTKQQDPVHAGTTVCATYDTTHIDFTPLGDLASTMETLIGGHAQIDFLLEHRLPHCVIKLDTREVREILGKEIPLDSYEVLAWIKAYLREQYEQQQIGGTQIDET